MEDRLDLYSLLEDKCPNLAKIVGSNQNIWTSINKRFNDRIDFIEESIRDNGTITVETTIFDLIRMSYNNDLAASRYLHYIDNLVYNIKSSIPAKLHKKFVASVLSLLANFDKTSSKYQNVIGEYTALMKILDLSQIKYDLVDLEYPLTNGKHVDFKIVVRDSGDELLIEVYNIHIKPNRIISEDNLETFLLKRLQDKVDNKLKNLSDNDLKSKFVVLPILWCDLDEMKRFEIFFNSFSKRNKGIACFAVAQFKDENGELYFMFDTMSNLLDQLATN